MADIPIDKDKFIQLSEETEQFWDGVILPMWEELQAMAEEATEDE